MPSSSIYCLRSFWKLVEIVDLQLVLSISGYFMPNRALFENVWPIASFALLGTCFNAVAIGFSLIGIAQIMPFSVQFTTIQLFLFSSLISACDPVAVIAFFEEIHVNAFLYVSVMGEALFNDSVVVMLYQMFSKFLAMGEENLLPVHYAQGVLSLLFIACGGALLGAICGFVAAFITKHSHRADTANPTTVFLFAYISFLLAELFGISSIISTTVYGMVTKQYVKENTEWQTSMSISYFVRVVSQASNAVTYLFLGLVLISIPSHYDVWFIIWTLVFCTIFRIIAVIVQCLYFNRFHYPRYTVIDQFILCFGGLRGAIAYGLALDIPDSVEAKPMFATTCLMVIYFTVFIQGVPMPYIVQWLKIKREHHDSNLMAGFHNICNNYTRSAIEAIIGQKCMHSCCQKYERINAKYMRPALIRDKKRQEFDASRIVRNYSKAAVSNAIAEMKFTDLNKTKSDQIELRERHGKEN
ncbi:hypothetical protein WR25_22385 isoform D [Diploscapter pachys]|uniref:Sodium/hydrogen exchanger n=2 Tax=Diploscapter pachys TaxID=2018661 RepID=A0A2A2L4Q5_9BILA|nr:hypothetical protein WR25_22385 isoform B [Diploscapter pachys]PAV81144.1 hypothetical protein WR25_22385 isoform D [Diploscapter pachys]